MLPMFFLWGTGLGDSAFFLNHLSCHLSSGHSPFKGVKTKAHEQNICLLKVLHPEAPVFNSSEKDTFPLKETAISKKNTNLHAV